MTGRRGDLCVEGEKPGLQRPPESAMRLSDRKRWSPIVGRAVVREEISGLRFEIRRGLRLSLLWWILKARLLADFQAGADQSGLKLQIWPADRVTESSNWPGSAEDCAARVPGALLCLVRDGGPGRAAWPRVHRPLRAAAAHSPVDLARRNGAGRRQQSGVWARQLQAPARARWES